MAKAQAAGSRALFAVVDHAAAVRIATGVGCELGSQNADDLAAGLYQALKHYSIHDLLQKKSQREKHDGESQAIGGNAGRLAAALRGPGLAAHTARQMIEAIFLAPHEKTMRSGTDLRDGEPHRQSSDTVDRFIEALTVLEIADKVSRKSRSGGRSRALSAIEWLISEALPPLALEHLKIAFNIDRASRYVKFVCAVLKEAGIPSPRAREEASANYTPAGIESALRRLIEKEKK
jgi:hypothetical protein